jgi:excisionase family DNA binding protein
MARMETTKESVLAAHGDYFTVREAAELLKMTPAHLRTEIRWGRIQAVRRGRLILIRPEVVAAQFSDAADPALVALAESMGRPTAQNGSATPHLPQADVRRPGTADTPPRRGAGRTGGKGKLRAG